MRGLLIILIALCMSCQSSFGQVRRLLQERTSVSFGTQLGSPRDEFRASYDELAYGFGGTFVTKNRLPFMYTGVNYTYARMGKHTEEVSLLSGVDIFGSPVYERANASLKNKVHRIHAVARFEPFRGKIQPYIEGMAGGVIYATSLELEYDSNFDREVTKDVLERSLAGSLGWSAGLKIQLMRGLFAEGRVETLRGGNARYVDPESVYMDINENFQYNLLESKTSSRIFHIGISLDI